MLYKTRTELRQSIIILIVAFFFVTLIFLNYAYFSTRAYIYEQSIRNQFSLPPGKFLWNFPPSNYSYCNFNYGLPAKINYTRNNLKYPPQEGENSSYRVLYNAVETYLDDNVPNVTYVTHVTVDFLLFIPEIARYWDGPISIAAFVPARDAQIFIQKITKLCFCLPQMSRVSIHLVFPVNHEPLFEEASNSSSIFNNCNIKNVFVDRLNRIENRLFYPINVGRNAAREAASTYYVMVTDIELIPSKHLAMKFMQFVKGFRNNETPFVFVVPIFEINNGYKVPQNKEQLQQSVKEGVAVYFHRYVCPHCQKFPGIDVWLDTPNSDSIRPFLTVKREYPFHRWEPIFIGTKQDPVYDEALSWEGLQDKMTQMLQMCLLNYNFVILDGAFLVHWPGIKKKGQRVTEAWRTSFIKNNSKEYNHITEQLSRVYDSNKNKKCKLQ
ncbi:hypothetical protein WA026_009659 [Henosepilachna vigintioctopunctata]|uniref:N-acetyllactosaminide beta-1,3-N-acetylglucosaminyltransferase n=1 Tax=Henosepilachna vigintioctopunctata TaxID=420089 RepID=A0AAW1U5D9_9CUCU